MAKRLKDFEGWEVLITDQDGKVIEPEKRGRSRRGQTVERIAIKRKEDGMSLTRGDSLKVRNVKGRRKNLGDFTFHLIVDIRLNTLNNLVEIWVLDYVNCTEVDPILYYSDLKPKVMELEESPEYYAKMFENEVAKDEIILSLEPSEISLKNFIGKVNVVHDKSEIKDPENDFVCNTLCSANVSNFVEFNLEQEILQIIDLPFKEVEEHLKHILFKPESETIKPKSARSSPKKKPMKAVVPEKTIIEFGESSSSDSESEDEPEISSSEEFKSGSDDDEEEEELDESVIDESSEEEDGDDEDGDESFEDTSETRKRYTPKSDSSSTEKPPRKKRKKELVKRKKRTAKEGGTIRRRMKKKTLAVPLIKKFTKMNIARAKKKYTPFSKKYKSIKDIPNLNELPEFYQQSKQAVFEKLESKLDTKKQHKIVETIFSKVKKQLYSSHGKEIVAKSKDFDDIIPGRENEFASIYLSVYSAIESSSATTVYIAGTPGVGKTLTVREVMKEISNSAINDELPPFSYVEINGLKMVKPTDSYEVLWSHISGESLTWGAAMESLEFYFNKVPQEKKRTMVILLDELDALVTKGQDIMYNLFNWTTYENAKLIVIAVANTMDLPERQLGNKISSRIGFTRIMFSGYNHDELKNIIDFRLKGLNNSYFYVDPKTGSAYLAEVDDDDGESTAKIPSGMRRVQLRMSADAIEIASRKVASVSGDARRALKVCKRAAEIAEQYYMKKHGFGYDGSIIGNDDDDDDEDNNKEWVENGEIQLEIEDGKNDSDEIQTVHIKHVMRALNETVNSQTVKYIVGMSFTTKLFLFGLLNLIKKSGLQEQTLGDIIDEIRNLIEVNGSNKYILNLQDMLYGKAIKDNYEQLRMISWDYLIIRLIESGLLIRQTVRNERITSVRLSVSVEDVKQALYQDETLKTL